METTNQSIIEPTLETATSVSAEMLRQYPFLSRSGVTAELSQPQQQVEEFFKTSPLATCLQDSWALRQRINLSIKHATEQDLPGYITSALHRSRTAAEQYYDSLVEMVKVRTGFTHFALEEYLQSNAGDNGL